MGIQSFLAILVIGVHVLIFSKSRHNLRRKRLLIAILVIIMGYPIMVLGILVGLTGQKDLIPLAKVLLQAPLIVSFASFLVYLSVGKNNA